MNACQRAIGRDMDTRRVVFGLTLIGVSSWLLLYFFVFHDILVESTINGMLFVLNPSMVPTNPRHALTLPQHV